MQFFVELSQSIPNNYYLYAAVTMACIAVVAFEWSTSSR